MSPPPPSLTEPPTADALRHASLHLDSIRSSMSSLDDKIASAELALAQLKREFQINIAKMTEEKVTLQRDEEKMKSYLSPVRRLPAELLREIFLWHFEEHEACAWVLAAVCSSWRRQALRTPRLWAKIRLITTPTSSPELVRLWLERSGPTVPLDIEIYLRAAEQPVLPLNSSQSSNFIDVQRRRPRRSSGSSTNNPAASWSSFTSHNGIMTHYVYPGASVPPLQALQSVGDGGSNTTSGEHREVVGVGAPTCTVNKPNIYWAHIAFYYLVEQMARWERFVFRYDKVFKSMTALASINGVAPLLKEFEVSSSDGGCTSDWPWLPNLPNAAGSSAPGSAPSFLPSLTSLTLHQVPFRWSSPIFSLAHLKHLNLRAPISPALSLDRIRSIISGSPCLETLALYFQGVLPNVLPLSPLVLENVKELRIGGHWLLSQLVDCLCVPKLNKLSLFVDPRESAEDVIIGLLTRSAAAGKGVFDPSAALTQTRAADVRLEELSLGYDTPPGPVLFPSTVHPSALPPASPPLPPNLHSQTHMNIHNMYHYYIPPPTGIIPSWRTLLTQMPHLRVLKVGGTPLEAFLVCLGNNEDDSLTGVIGSGISGNGNGWLVPKLEVLQMRGWCATYGYGNGNPFGAGVGPGGVGSGNGAGYGMGGSEAVAKLVGVIEARNPDLNGLSSGGWNGQNSNGWGSSGTGSGVVKRLKYLGMHDCDLGTDVEKWLGGRVESVVCVDPPLCERTIRRRRYF